MKIMKKSIVIALILLVSISALAGCNKKQEVKDPETPATPAAALADQFMKEAESEQNISKIAQVLSQNEAIALVKVVEQEMTNEEYLPGFTKEIKEFSKAVKVQPMVATIPFICYVFETENPKGLVQELKDNADLRWNICTEAEEMEIRERGNSVFFVMAPKSFDDQE